VIGREGPRSAIAPGPFAQGFAVNVVVSAFASSSEPSDFDAAAGFTAFAVNVVVSAAGETSPWKGEVAESAIARRLPAAASDLAKRRLPPQRLDDSRVS
jgi:hypothetical protein